MVLLKKWMAVSSLGFAVFIFVTSEFAPVGLIEEISKSIGEKADKTGLLLTAYAWVVALVSLPLTLATAFVERRKLLLSLLFIFCVGNFVVTFFSSFMPVMLSRLIVALCHAIFWSITTPLAVRLAPKPAYGLGMLAAGVTMGSVLGMPISTFIGQRISWQASFRTISGASIVVMLILFFVIPNSPAKNTGSLKSLPQLFKNIPLICSYAVTMILVSGDFTIYTYMVPYLTEQVGLSGEGIVAMLFLFGFSGVIGIFITSKFMEQHLLNLMTGALTVVLSIMFIQAFFSQSTVSTGIFFVIWSASFSVFAICMQSLILKLSPQAQDAAMSIHSGIFNVGIGSGALIGSYVLRSFGSSNLLVWATLIAVPSLIMMTFVRRIVMSKQAKAHY